ncbi:hypothetical protein CMI47_09250 [Candidatus Pacearchaeota archaeon]|jgi:hypothetical protein|nr:hypothetical protein [Candidatus Pacearchaeota archaeon]
MSESSFENEVLEKLSLIEGRLSNIEERFEDATGFADSILSDESGLFGKDGLNSIKDTLSALMPSQLNSEQLSAVGSDPASLTELVGSLKDFRERLSGIKSAIADLPDEALEAQVNDE